MKKQLTKHQEELESIRQLSAELFPDPFKLVLINSEAEQRDELQRLQKGLQHEQFFMVVDLIRVEIVAAAGHYETMGWPEKLTFKKYLSLFPNNGMLQLMTILGKQTFRFSHQTENTFLQPKFVVNLPLITADGRTVLAKRTVSPWQITAEGYVTAYLSEFVVIKEYEGEPFSPRFVGISDPVLEERFNQMVKTFFANLPPKVNRFTPKEMEVIRLYSEDKANEKTSADIARLAKISTLTIKDYNKSILEKARDMFGESPVFQNARDVAQYLHKNRLLGR